jgi:hypothetical protein
MIPSVVAHFMTLGYLSLEDLRVGFDHLPDHEEGRVDVTLLQDVEEFGCVERVLAVGSRTVIEGHRNVGTIDMHRADTAPGW